MTTYDTTGMFPSGKYAGKESSMRGVILFKVVYWISYLILLPLISISSVLAVMFFNNDFVIEVISVVLILFSMFTLFWMFINKRISRVTRVFTIIYFAIILCLSITTTVGLGFILNDYRSNQDWISDQISILDRNDESNLILVRRISGFADKIEMIELYNCRDIKEIKNNKSIINETIPENDSAKSGRINMANNEIIIQLNSNKNLILKFAGGNRN